MTRRRLLAATALSACLFAAPPANAIPFELYDGSDKYLDALGLFDREFYEILWDNVSSGGNADLLDALDTAIDGGAAYALGFDLNSLTLLDADEAKRRAALIEEGNYNPVQQRIINSVSATFRLKDDDTSFWDFSERGIGGWWMDGGRNCSFSDEVDSMSFTCDLGMPDFSDNYYLGFGFMAAVLRDFDINYIRIWGDYTPIETEPAPIPGPSPATLLFAGVLSLLLGRRILR